MPKKPIKRGFKELMLADAQSVYFHDLHEEGIYVCGTVCVGRKGYRYPSRC